MTPILRTALGRRGQVAAILDGHIAPQDFAIEHIEVTPLPRAFRMMVNEKAFDLAEMPIVTLAMAIEHGREITGIPAVLNRDFHHRSILVNTHSGIRHPNGLIGRRVGVRAYSQTTGVWVRGLLQDEYGVAPESTEWVTLESAHVEKYQDPAHVTRAPAGKTLEGMLIAGEIDAAVIMDPRLEHPAVAPLFSDAMEMSQNWYARTGIYPVNHVLAIDTAIAEAYPGLVKSVYRLFLDSKQAYAAALQVRPSTDEDQHKLALAAIIGGDPMPYGIRENARAMHAVLSYAHSQGLITHSAPVANLFHEHLAMT
jgi:4,5-dihydroxyphthalate decarboxylase